MPGGSPESTRALRGRRSLPGLRGRPGPRSPAGPTLGPPLGGYLVDNYSWNWCFEINILPGIFSIYLFDPNDIRLEFSCQPSNGEGEPLIVPQVTQTKDEALRELKSLTRDKAWLDKATAGLRE